MIDADLEPRIDELVRETRAARQALHGLIDRIRGDRLRWDRDARQLLHRRRLTAGQRQRLRERFQSGQPGGGTGVC